MIKFKVGQRVRYLGGAWEPGGYKIIVGSIRLITKVGKDYIRLAGIPHGYEMWNYYHPDRHFAPNHLSDKIKVI